MEKFQHNLTTRLSIAMDKLNHSFPSIHLSLLASYLSLRLCALYAGLFYSEFCLLQSFSRVVLSLISIQTVCFRPYTLGDTGRNLKFKSGHRSPEVPRGSTDEVLPRFCEVANRSRAPSQVLRLIFQQLDNLQICAVNMRRNDRRTR